MTDITRQAWFRDEAARQVMTALTQNGKEARFIGGCVRDAYAGRVVHDIDIATAEVPQTVMTLLEQKGIKAIPTGIEHGTVSALCQGKIFEITTLRSDVSTDGRRACVAFCEDWLEDAKRRDFTFNAMSVDAQGNLFDPFDGLADLRAGLVRFIGRAEDRIREDYLRLLRYFRFCAYFSKTSAQEEALQACVALAGGLDQLSGERIAQELLRLLSAPRPAKWINLMIRHNILQHILPDVLQKNELEMLCAFEDQPDSLRRLACLLPNDFDVVSAVAQRLRLSNKDRQRLLGARCGAMTLDPMKGEKHLRCFLYRCGAIAARDQLFLYWAEKGFSGIGPREQAILAQIDHWQETPLSFPLSGGDLLTRGFEGGAHLGKCLKEIESWWCEQGCFANKEECLHELARRHSL